MSKLEPSAEPPQNDNFHSQLDNPNLQAKEKILLQKNIMRKIIEEARNQKNPILPHLPNDLLAGEVYVRKLEHHRREKVVGIMGVTKSDIDGVTETPHSMYFKPKDLAYWENLPQEERRKQFLEKHLPNFKRVVITIHGWGANRTVYEVPIGKMLKEGEEDETLYISLSTMGSEGTIDSKRYKSAKENPFGCEAAVAQVYEALDHIGLHMNFYKAKEIESSDWNHSKSIFARNAAMWFIENVDKKKNEFRPSLDILLDIIKDEQEVINGTYFFNRIKAVVGHSMGGWVDVQMFLANYLKKFPDTKNLYLNKFNVAAGRTHETISGMVTRSRLDSAAQNGNRQKNEFFDILSHHTRKLVGLKSPYYSNKSDRVSELYPNAKYIALAPVIMGKEKYKKTYAKVKKYLNHIKFMTSLYTPIIKSAIWLDKPNLQKLRNEWLKLGDTTGIMPRLLAHLIGRNAVGFDEISEAHGMEINENGPFIDLSTENLDDMPEIAGDNTRFMMAQSDFLGRLHLIIADLDQILEKTDMDKFITDIAGKSHPPLPERLYHLIKTNINDSNHYLSEKGINALSTQLHEWFTLESNLRHQDRDKLVKILQTEMHKEFLLNPALRHSPVIVKE